MIKIKTQRLNIFSFRKNHITKKYISWINDSSITKFSRHKKIKYDKKKAENFYYKIKKNNHLFLGIAARKTNRLIGTSIVYRDFLRNEANIGIMIGDKKYFKKSLGYEAFKFIVKSLKKEKFKIITAGVNSKNNIGMISIAKKMKMKFIYKKPKKKIVYLGKNYVGEILFVI